MVAVTRWPHRYRKYQWVRANDGRVGVVLEQQAGLVYRIRSGCGEYYYAESQLEPAEPAEVRARRGQSAAGRRQ